MIFKTLFTDIWKYSKPLFFFVIAFIAIQLYYSIQFACLARLVDSQKPVPHPFAFEAFPFVVYNMYSGKIDDWNKYSYLKIEADGQEVLLTDLAVIQEDQFVNPSQKFIGLRANNFHDDGLYAFLKYALDSSERTNRIYRKVSNEQFLQNEAAWGNWMKKYLSATLKHEVKSIKISECSYSYNVYGKPELLEQKPVYQFE